jgi:hypothetical protein
MNVDEKKRLDIPILILWLLIQIAALGISAARVPLSARFPRPAEDQALIVMMIVQQVFGALLMARLFSSRTAETSITVIVPFTFLAASLSQNQMTTAVVCSTCTSLWLITLGVWAYGLKSTRSKLVASGVFTLYAISGPLLQYLESEYGNGATTISHFHPGPISATLAMLSNDLTPFCVQISGLLLIAVVLLIVQRRKTTSYPPKFSTVVQKSP